MTIKFLSEFGKAFIPQKIRPKLRNYLLKAGIIDVPYDFFGGLFIASLVLTYFAFMFFLFPLFLKWNISGLRLAPYAFFGWFITNMGIILILMSIVYFYLDLLIYKRTKQMESVLIEFLDFVSDNLKGGMAFDKALWSAVKPKFKVLAAEIRIAAKKSMTGEDVEQALEEFTEKYDSPTLKRSFSLIVEGMRGGSQIADIIDKVVENLKETRELKEDMSATALSYVIFISIIVLTVAPGLFALSKQLLVILGGFAEQLGSSLANAGGGLKLPIKFEELAITPEDFSKFAMASLAVISGFAAMVLSIIKDGTIKDGVKYIPFFVIVSIFLFTVISKSLEFLMGGLVG